MLSLLWALPSFDRMAQSQETDERVPDRMTRATAHMGRKIVERKKPVQFVVVVNDNEAPHVFICQNVSSIR